MAVMVQSCGPSEEERQKLQAENERIINEKVDEIIVMNEEVMKQSSIAKKMGMQTRTKATEFSKLVAELKISH